MFLIESYPQFVNKTIHLFNKMNIEYMIVGGASAAIQGFNIVTQDIDLYVDKTIENKEKLKIALKKLGFKLSVKDVENIDKGKDFIQFNKPYELDIMFAPDGFENYDEAKKYKIKKDQFSLMSLDGIIKSKKASNRPKDKAVLQLLIDFNKFQKDNKEYRQTESNLFFVPNGYKVADIQTLNRWKLNKVRSIQENLKRGLK